MVDDDQPGPQATPSRPPASRREWETALYDQHLDLAVTGLVRILMDFADWQDGRPGVRAFPGHEELARRARISERHVHRLLTQALAAGVIRLARRKSPGRAQEYCAGVPNTWQPRSRPSLPVLLRGTAQPVPASRRHRTPMSGDEQPHRTSRSETPDLQVRPSHPDHLRTPSVPQTSDLEPTRPRPAADGRDIDLVVEACRAACEAAGQPFAPGGDVDVDLADAIASRLQGGWTGTDLVERIAMPSWAGARSGIGTMHGRLKRLDGLEPPRVRAAREHAVQQAETAARKADAAPVPTRTAAERRAIIAANLAPHLAVNR